MEKVEILTPEQLEKQTDARLDAYLEQVKNYMALDMPSDQLGTYKELVQSIMAEKESRKNRNVPEDNPDGWESPAGTENTAGGFDIYDGRSEGPGRGQPYLQSDLHMCAGRLHRYVFLHDRQRPRSCI